MACHTLTMPRAPHCHTLFQLAKFRKHPSSLDHCQPQPTYMRRLLLTLAATIIPLVALAQETHNVGYPTVAAALEALNARSDVNISVAGGWTIVDDSAANTIWSFTPSNHPAHPTVVKRSLVSRDGAVFIDMTALCQAKKPACDRLMEEFQALNAQLGKSMNDRTAGSEPAQQSEINVQRIGNDLFRLSLKSYRSKTVEAGQQELFSTAQQACGGRVVQYGKYQFETKEALNATAANGAMLMLKQDVGCTTTAAGVETRAEPPKKIGPAWLPAPAQVQRVERLTKTYFAARDGRRYMDAYQLFSFASKQISPFERWSSGVEDFNSKVGSVVRRDIKKITWYKNPPQAAPGTYAAVDFSSQFANANIHCGSVIWVEQDDGTFQIVREEENVIDKSMENALTPDELAKARAQFGCRE